MKRFHRSVSLSIESTVNGWLENRIGLKIVVFEKQLDITKEGSFCLFVGCSQEQLNVLYCTGEVESFRSLN